MNITVNNNSHSINVDRNLNLWYLLLRWYLKAYNSLSVLGNFSNSIIKFYTWMIMDTHHTIKILKIYDERVKMFLKYFLNIIWKYFFIIQTVVKHISKNCFVIIKNYNFIFHIFSFWMLTRIYLCVIKMCTFTYHCPNFRSNKPSSLGSYSEPNFNFKYMEFNLVDYLKHDLISVLFYIFCLLI